MPLLQLITLCGPLIRFFGTQTDFFIPLYGFVIALLNTLYVVTNTVLIVRNCNRLKSPETLVLSGCLKLEMSEEASQETEEADDMHSENRDTSHIFIASLVSLN